MGSLAELFHGRGEPQRSPFIEALVASGPPNITVRLRSFDGGRARWPVDGYPETTADPARGDRCLVAFSNRGRLWIIAFAS